MKGISFHSVLRVSLYLMGITSPSRVASAQVASGIITGVVLDPSAAVIPDPTVILKKQLRLDLGLYIILQVLSLALFEKNPISQLFTNVPPKLLEGDPAIQLHSSNLWWDSCALVYVFAGRRFSPK
jgi:hypothetical protein